MSAQSSPLNDLFPEIFPVIASHLPLHATPSTLLSLALINRRISNIVLPLVYSCLILRNENDALTILQKLLDEPELGKLVREVHILSDLSIATRTGKNPFDVVRGLEKVIAAGSLPYIHTLDIRLLSRWHYDNNFRTIEGFGQLRAGFWASLRKHCPRLRGLVLRNIGDCEADLLAGLFEMRDITRLKLYFETFPLSEGGVEKLLKNITSFCGSLHTLDLTLISLIRLEYAKIVRPLLSICFPRLRSLSLPFPTPDDAGEAMAFWERHSTLENLKVVASSDVTSWFKNELPANFLPNLKHLKAHFRDVRILAPILNQLVSLTVYDSINAQIPYLLRVVLPEGLPNLKSLNIGQYPFRNVRNMNIEGSLWHETKDGKFNQAEIHKASRSVWDGYIHSIARGAPNLEELGFFHYKNEFSEFVKIASDFAEFSQLKRFYHHGTNASLSYMKDKEREVFISNARILAEACCELTVVIDTSNDNPPFVAARIHRGEGGEIIKVDLGTGYGLHIGHDHEAFPPR